MMRAVAHVIAVAILLSITAAAQARLGGKWEGQTPGRQSVVLELTTNGEALTGTMTVGAEQAPIENGKTSKTTVSFSVAMEGATERFTGELAGDELKIWMDDRGPSSAIVLKRVK